MCGDTLLGRFVIQVLYFLGCFRIWCSNSGALICRLVVRLTEDQELFSGVNLPTAATGCIVGKIRWLMWVKTTIWITSFETNFLNLI